MPCRHIFCRNKLFCLKKMKMMRCQKYISPALAAALFYLVCAGCTSQNLEKTYATLEENIDKYITTNFSDSSLYTIHRNAGSNRITVNPSDSSDFEMPSDTLMAGGNVVFDYAMYIFGNSFPPTNMIAATTQELADQGGLWGDSTVFQPVSVNLSDRHLLEGLRNGLLGVYAGEECYIIFSPEYGFGNDEVNAIPKMSSLMYHIWIHSIENR